MWNFWNRRDFIMLNFGEIVEIAVSFFCDFVEIGLLLKLFISFNYKHGDVGFYKCYFAVLVS